LHGFVLRPAVEGWGESKTRSNLQGLGVRVREKFRAFGKFDRISEGSDHARVREGNSTGT
jgi:hypothetical protein